MRFINLYFLIPVLLLVSCFSLNDQKKNNTTLYIDTVPQPPFEKVAETLTRKITAQGFKLIVMTFSSTEGKEHKNGSLYAEKITTEIAKRGNVIVLDRLLFSRKLTENNLNLVSGSDFSQIKKIGEVLGVDAVVTGVVTPYASGYDVNCRLIDAKTGMILSAEEAFYPSGGDQ